MALIVPGEYCSHVALHSRHFWDTSTSRRNNRISISPPWREKMARPHARRGFIGGQKKRRRVAHFGNLHRCSSRSRLVSGDLDT